MESDGESLSFEFLPLLDSPGPLRTNPFPETPYPRLQTHSSPEQGVPQILPGPLSKTKDLLLSMPLKVRFTLTSKPLSRSSRSDKRTIQLGPENYDSKIRHSTLSLLSLE